MKIFEAKTIEEAVEKAATEMNLPKEQVHYIIREEKQGGLLGLGKSATIEVYSMEDVCNYGSEYLKNAIKSIGIDIEVKTEVNTEQNIVRMTINSERNPILIGRNGRTLRALNDLVRLAVSNHFKRRYRILLDVGDYKDKKYSKIIGLARRAAKIVERDHIDIKLDAMTSDERRMIHQVLTNMSDVRTESIGEGEKRAVVIKYVGGDEHAFQTKEVYYKDVMNDHHNHHSHEHRPRAIHEESSLSDLLHKDADILKNEVKEDKPLNEVRSENKMNEADKTIDDLPSASISSPLVNKDALKDLEDKPVDEKSDTPSNDSKPEENK